jgi:hypothetical protein
MTNSYNSLVKNFLIMSSIRWLILSYLQLAKTVLIEIQQHSNQPPHERHLIPFKRWLDAGQQRTYWQE